MGNEEDDERNVEWDLKSEKTVNDRDGAEVEAAMDYGGKAEDYLSRLVDLIETEFLTPELT